MGNHPLSTRHGSLFEGRDLTLIPATVESYEREGTRRYDVYLDGKGIGEIERYRERYPYKNIGGNVALFRSRWSWRNNKTRISYDTRREAVERLVKAVEAE